MLPGLMIRIWRKQNENMDPSCLVTTVQAGGGGVMVWGMFSWHTSGPLVPIGHRLNATAYQSIVSDHASARKLNMRRNFIFQHDNGPKNTSKSTKEWLHRKKFWNGPARAQT
uniref:Tc1-like transposase DDE domain-containing protein n=1 Tax=Xenopus tropicalis TaxID=8364 RepID=A0A803K269_XENTR